MTLASRGESLAPDIGRLGIFSIEFNPVSVGFPAGDLAPLTDAAAELEALGFTTLWVPGGPEGAAVLDVAAAVLDSTERLVLGTDILTIWTRDPSEMAAPFASLESAHPGRFVLGLGVSHANLVEPRGQVYAKPVEVMRRYLEDLDATTPSVPRRQRMIAALGPRMLEVARDHAAGSLPYMVSADHTVFARETLGVGPTLAPELAVVLDADPARARDAGRRHLSRYFHYTNYVDNFRRQGFDDRDLEGGGSDRLVDAIVAWGDMDAIAVRIQEHRAAGADHLALQVLRSDQDDPTQDPTRLPLEQWRRLSELVDAASR